MESFDVIIVGGGPAGLQCASTFTGSGLRVLLLEKQEIFGDKLCAGGLTLKDLEIIDLPVHVMEHQISHACLHSLKRSVDTILPEAFLFTVNRRELGAWQHSQLKGTGTEVRTGSRVKQVAGNEIIMHDNARIQFRFLVGADGYASVVRRSLGLDVKKRLIGYQYTLPVEKVPPRLEIFLDSRKFSAWYAWIFPHRDSLALGCCCDPAMSDHRRMKKELEDWVRGRGLDPESGRLESYPISYDYRGVRFGNIFLAGEAAGLASGFTGEGIYQSLASGREVARMIMDPDYSPGVLEEIVRYNRVQEKVMKFTYRAGALRSSLHELLLFLMSTKPVRMRITRSFS